MFLFYYGFGSRTVINYFSGSGSASQKVTVPTVPVLVPQHWCPVVICKLLEVLSFQYGIPFLPYLFVTGSSVEMVCFFSVTDPHSFYAGPETTLKKLDPDSEA